MVFIQFTFFLSSSNINKNKKAKIIFLIINCILIERQKTKSGETVVLKLKDCPSGEDFKTMMPARYIFLYLAILTLDFWGWAEIIQGVR